MKPINRRLYTLMIAILIAGLALAGLPGSALAAGGERAQGLTCEKFLMGGTYSLANEQLLEGNLCVLGGLASVGKDATIDGDIYLAGGTLKLDGTVAGSIFATGGLIDLGDNALVKGDISTLGGRVTRAEGAQVRGQISEGDASAFRVGPLPFDFARPGSFPSGVWIALNPVWQLLGVLLRSFIWAVLAILVTLFLPNPVRRAARTAASQPLISGGLGLVTVVAAIPILVVLTITICLIPVSLAGAAAMTLAWMLGVIAIGEEAGKRIAHLFHSDPAPAAAAGLGALVVTLTADLIGTMVPCIGWLAPFLLGCVALGAGLLTRFGTRDYPSLDPIGGAPATIGLPASDPPMDAGQVGSYDPLGQ
jgi:hypothetical protein